MGMAMADDFLSYYSLLILTGFMGIFLAWRFERGNCQKF